VSAIWVRRQDRGELLGSKPGPGGSLLVTGYAAREGVLVYRNADGTTTREFVPLKTLKDSAKTLGRAAVTLEHPDEDVTPENVGELGVGDVGSKITIHDDGYVEVTAAVRRADALEAVRAGKVELSPGYSVRIDPTPGEHPVYGRYDAVQVERVVNHLAIVDRARGGETIRIRADSAVATTVIGASKPTHPGMPRSGGRVNTRFLALLSLLGITQRIDSDDAAIDAAVDAVGKRKDAADRSISEAQARHDAAINDLKAKLTAAEAARDVEKKRADDASAELATIKASETARADAAARTELETLATGMGLDPKASPDTKALKRAIATKHLGELKADADDSYVAVVVDIAQKEFTKKNADRQDGLRASQDAWKGDPSGTVRTDSGTGTAQGAQGAQAAEPYLSPAQLMAKKNRDSFNAARGGGAA
jgi:hypothetical protein